MKHEGNGNCLDARREVVAFVYHVKGLDSIQGRVLGTSNILSCEGHGQICFLETFLWHLEGEWSSKRQEQNPRYDAITTGWQWS